MIRTIAKEKKLPTLIREADELFSELIRRQRAVNGYVTCITCPKVLPFRQAQLCHTFHRDNMATRYDELNVWPGCAECNCFDPDHDTKIKSVVRRLIGDAEFYDLSQRAQSMVKFTRPEMLEMIEGFKEKLKKLK